MHSLRSQGGPLFREEIDAAIDLLQSALSDRAADEAAAAASEDEEKACRKCRREEEGGAGASADKSTGDAAAAEADAEAGAGPASGRAGWGFAAADITRLPPGALLCFFGTLTATLPPIFPRL